MLGLANANRRRVDAQLDDSATIDRHAGALRKAIVAEFAIGLVIVAITAAMVVSPPSISQAETGAPTGNQPDVILHLVVVISRKVATMILRRLAAPSIALALTATLAACGSDDPPAADTTAITQTPTGTATDVELNAADIEFAQGMIAHHEQAIEMAEIALDPNIGASPEVVDLATRIKGAQDPEVELMTGWLTAAGEPVAMDTSEGHDMSSMEGMMTAEQMDSMAGDDRRRVRPDVAGDDDRPPRRCDRTVADGQGRRLEHRRARPCRPDHHRPTGRDHRDASPPRLTSALAERFRRSRNIPPGGIVDGGEEVAMNHAHHHPESALDEPTAHRSRIDHDGHALATAHDHHADRVTPAMTSTPVTTRRCSGAGSG